VNGRLCAGRRFGRGRNERGVTLALAALAFPALLGMGALAVDVGYLYVARNVLQNAADAGAMAGANVLAGSGSQSSASQQAVSFASQNIAGIPYLAGSSPIVNFPTGTSVRVRFNRNVGLFFAPVVGFSAANVQVSATAGYAAVNGLPPNGIVPLAIYCNNPGGCSGQLALNQVFSNLKRHCGNFFGSSGSTCSYNPETPADGEVFLTGMTLDDAADVSNSQFRDEVYGGSPASVSIGQTSRALPGTRQGWASGMSERLAEGRNEMTFVVIERLDPPVGNHNIRVVDFVQVRVDSFSVGHGVKQDTFGFEIIQSPVSSQSFAAQGQGLGLNSVVAVRLSE
jgi:Flp pilus assembly protein TadG